MSPSIDLLIPISPTPSFTTKAILLTESIRRFYPNTNALLFLGGEWSYMPVQLALKEQLSRWLKFPKNRAVIVEEPDFRKWARTRSPFLETMNRRFSADHLLSDYQIILDADVICVRPFDELFQTDAVQGVMAHVSPLQRGDWRKLFQAVGAKWPEFNTYEYSGKGIMRGLTQRGPWYVNSGMVFAPRHLFEKLVKPYHKAIATMGRMMTNTYWFDQLALAAAVAMAEVPHRVLPVKFNFPNQIEFDDIYEDDMNDVRFIHYLRTKIVDRDTEFTNRATLRQFISREDLKGSNKILQETVADVMKTMYPPDLERVEDAPWA